MAMASNLGRMHKESRRNKNIRQFLWRNSKDGSMIQMLGGFMKQLMAMATKIWGDA